MGNQIAAFPAGRTPSGRRWGKAGVRLSAEEADAADRARRVQANKERLAEEAALRKARADWASGHVQPWRISQALDAAGLWGPEVDEKCGGAEPMVDDWEAGTRASSNCCCSPNWPRSRPPCSWCGPARTRSRQRRRACGSTRQTSTTNPSPCSTSRPKRSQPPSTGRRARRAGTGDRRDD